MNVMRNTAIARNAGALAADRRRTLLRVALGPVASVVLLLGAVHLSRAEDAQRIPEPGAVAASTTAGTVRKVDKSAGKITIQHEAIKNLGMPKMTMVFRVKDAVLLDSVKPGDKIRFAAEKIEGAYTVIRMDVNP